jgi:hypothetical protein
MVQMHALAAGIDGIRPTDDLDMPLHVEVITGVAQDAARHLDQLGYQLQMPTGRSSPAYRFTRRTDVIDVMAADHVAPSRRELLLAAPMSQVEGGTQALQRTMLFVVQPATGARIELSVPDELGALILKAAAYRVDTRDRDRHLNDAAVLAATITDHARELARLKGTDLARLRLVVKALEDSNHPSWLALSEQHSNSRPGHVAHPDRRPTAWHRESLTPVGLAPLRGVPLVTRTHCAVAFRHHVG